MKDIKYLWLSVLPALVFAAGACNRDRDEPIESRKPVEVDVRNDETMRPDVDVDNNNNDFSQTRERESSELRARLSRLDNRIAELRAEGSEESRELADNLRARRDELAARIERAGEQTEEGWDEFKRDVSESFAELERDIDDEL